MKVFIIICLVLIVLHLEIFLLIKVDKWMFNKGQCRYCNGYLKLVSYDKSKKKGVRIYRCSNEDCKNSKHIVPVFRRTIDKKYLLDLYMNGERGYDYDTN